MPRERHGTPLLAVLATTVHLRDDHVRPVTVLLTVMGTNSDRAMAALERGIDAAIAIVAADDDQVRRARNAELLSARCRDAVGEFAGERTVALRRLRDAGLSLNDMTKLFGVTRMALSAAINRESARPARKAARVAAKRR